MKVPCLLVVLLASATWLRAADPEGFGLWKSSAIKNSGKELAGKIDDQKFSFQSLGTYGNHMIRDFPSRRGRQRRAARNADRHPDRRHRRSHAHRWRNHGRTKNGQAA